MNVEGLTRVDTKNSNLDLETEKGKEASFETFCVKESSFAKI